MARKVAGMIFRVRINMVPTPFTTVDKGINTVTATSIRNRLTSYGSSQASWTHDTMHGTGASGTGPG
jgi:hypothetical protein